MAAMPLVLIPVTYTPPFIALGADKRWSSFPFFFRYLMIDNPHVMFDVPHLSRPALGAARRHALGPVDNVRKNNYSSDPA